MSDLPEGIINICAVWRDEQVQILLADTDPSRKLVMALSHGDEGECEATMHLMTLASISPTMARPVITELGMVHRHDYFVSEVTAVGKVLPKNFLIAVGQGWDSNSLDRFDRRDTELSQAMLAASLKEDVRESGIIVASPTPNDISSLEDE